MATNPSLLIVPYRFKAAKLYSQLPESGAGDFTVTRSTTATRTNASGLLESVASGVPRLDYQGGGCPALLVEPAATNLLLRSEEFETTWTAGNVALTANATTAPNNTLTAEKVVATAVNDFHQLDQVITIADNTNYTISVFAKKAEINWFSFACTNKAGVTYLAWFNLDTGVVGTVTAGATARISLVGNGYYRCEMSYPSQTGAATTRQRIRINSQDNQFAWLGNGTDGIFLWGAQLETGSVATSYIPTVAATQTRNADVISLSSVSGLIGQAQGTIYAEVDLRNLTKETHFIRIDGGASTNVITLRTLTNNVVRTNITAPTTSGTLNISSAEFSSGVVKIAFAYKSGDIALSVNGASALTANGTFAFNAALSRIFLGSNDGTSFLNDRIRAAAIYTSRLSNAELATLTTL